MPKGRPIKTEIREKVGAILQKVNIAYGYQIYKLYKEIFGNVSLRNLYYNLKKGVDLGEFVVVEVKLEKGDYTWGGEVEHKYYAIGPYALFFKTNDKQKQKLGELKTEDIKIEWINEIKRQLALLSEKIKSFDSIKVRLKYEDKRKLENNFKTSIEYLKEWSKQKIGKSEVIDAELKILADQIRQQVNPPTP